MAFKTVTTSAMTAEPDRRHLPATATVRVWHAPDGWPLRVVDVPAGIDVPRRGALLFQGGRGDFAEKYAEALRDFAAAGWDVTTFDWRGQGASGRTGGGAHVGDIPDFGLYARDLAAFWGDWRARSPGPHAVVGHSMGGYATLRALVDGGIDPGAAVLVAPMLGLAAPGGARLGEAAARVALRLGRPTRAAWRAGERPGALRSRMAMLTHDADRYADEPWWHRRDPRLLTGPPSWRWLVGAFAATRRLRAAPALKAMTTPVLMLVAEADALVDPRAAIAVARALPDARVVRFGAESAHEILREVDAVRDRALAAIDAFFRERLEGAA